MKRLTVFFSPLTAAAVLFTAVLGILSFSACGTDSIALGNTVWIPLRAVDASEDEVQLNDIYNANYSNYQGTLTFQDNKTFELWMGPGDPTDGTHSGTYEQQDGKINVFFDDNTAEQFEILKDGDHTLIAVPYDGYRVYFKKQ